MKIKIKEGSAETSKKMIALELPEELYQELRKEAFEQELSLSAMIRQMIKEYLLKERKEN